MAKEDKVSVVTAVAQKAKESPIAAISVLGTIITLITGIVGGRLFIDNRFAHADELAKYKQAADAVQQQTTSIQQMLLMQIQTRKTILEMKQAEGKLTPEEKVELQGLKDIIKQSDKSSSNQQH